MTTSTKKDVKVSETEVSGSSSSSSIHSEESHAQASYSPRKARSAEATTVHSPASLGPNVRSLDMIPAAFNSYHPQTQPADVGFGYMPEFERNAGIEMPVTPFSAVGARFPNTPGAMSRMTLGGESVLSPTFREEMALEKTEKETEKQQAEDLKVKTRVRLAKLLLRYTNFTCSLIVLSLLSTTFQIFNATKALPLRSSLPPWAANTVIWPQVTLLSIACVSLLISIIIIYRNWRHRNSRSPEKAVVYYTVFSIAFFVANIVMWLAGLLILHLSRQRGNGKDIWGWACKDGMRKDIFKDQVAYDVVCRMQQWSLVCAAIEIIVETLTLSVYGIVLYRYYTRKRLQKAMSSRDKARSDLYLAHVRLQSAPNSPGYLTRQASMRAQQTQSQTYPQTVDVYTNPFLTPAPFTAQPLLAGCNRLVEEEEDRQVMSGPSTMYAVPKAKPFVLSAAPPRKGKGSAQQSPRAAASSATSPQFASDTAISPVQTIESSAQAQSPPRDPQNPVGTFGTQSQQQHQQQPRSISTPLVSMSAHAVPATLLTHSAFSPITTTSIDHRRPVSLAWPPSPTTISQPDTGMHMPAAPGEQSYEHVPIPGAYGVVSPLPSPGLYTR